MGIIDELRRNWVAVDYAAYYEQEVKRIQRPWRFNFLVEVIAVALADEREREKRLRRKRSR